jgi:hypothetical protein
MARKKAANTNAEQAGNAVPARRPLPADPNLLRRLHRAIHGFCDWLEAELEAAVAAANHRQLGAVRFVEQACRYLRQRCMTQAEPSNPVAVQKPTGFSIDPDLVLALGCLEATAFTQQLHALHAAIAALEPFEGTKFGRKPIRIDKRADVAAKPKQEQQEQEALTALRQCSAALPQAFLDLDDAVVKRLHRAAKAGHEKRGDGMLTPPQLAKRWGVSPDKVLAWIRSGELRASNIAKRAGGRPRYLIDPAEAEAFWARRSLEKPPPMQRRKRRDTEYF